MSYDLAPDPARPPTHPDEDLALPGQPARNRAKMTIESDLECVHCGYNLRGLSKKHRCPECGTPAGFSVGGDLLLLAPVPWLKTLRNGLALIVWAILLGIAALVNVFFYPELGHLFDVVRASLAWTGIMLLTTPEPKTITRREGLTVRRIIRLLAAGGFLCALLTFLSSSVRLLTMSSFAVQLANAAPAFNQIAFLLWIANLMCLAIFLRGLAGRIPEDDLERTTTYIINGFAVSLGLSVALWTFSLVFAPFPSVVGPAPCVAMFASGCACVFVVWFGVLVFRYYSTIKWAAHEAQVQAAPPLQH